MQTLKTVLIAPLVIAASVQAAAARVTVADAADWPITPYTCAANAHLDVRYSPDGTYATIDQMDERILMKLVPSASGARYRAMDRDYSYELDTKGDDATLYEAGDRIVLDDCVTGG